MSSIEKLRAAIAECKIHVALLAEALAAIESARPFTAETVTHLSAAQRRLLDQLAYRFIKLQDTLGERVLPGLLVLTEEPIAESATFAEKLQRLERLGAVTSTENWRLLRELRNQIAHEYPDAPDLQAAAINRALGGVEELLAFWAHVGSYAERHGAGRP